MDKDVVIPDAVEEANAIFPGITQEFTEVSRLAHLLGARQTTNAFERTVLLLCGIVWQHYNAIILLLAHGFGVQSLIVCRTLFECVVVTLYLLKHPNLHDDYLDWGKLAFYEQAVAAGFGNKLVAIGAECEEVKKRFKSRSGKGIDPWHRSSIKKMAEAVRLEVFYKRFYTDASSAVHSDATKTLHLSSQGWRQSLKQFTGDQEGDVVRYASFQLVAMLFYQANETLVLGHNEEANSLNLLRHNRAKAAAMPN